VIKRIAVMTSALLVASALALVSTTVAEGATGPLFRPGPGVHMSADGTVSCSGSNIEVFQNSYDGGNGQYFYSRTASPHQVLANTAHTGYCIVILVDSGGIALASDGTGDCITINTASKDVDTDPCNYGIAQTLATPSISDGVWVEFFDDTNDCIYQDGRDSPVDYAPCTSSTGDVWLEQ
jgi:hypothetical protein